MSQKTYGEWMLDLMAAEARRERRLRWTYLTLAVVAVGCLVVLAWK